MNLKAFLLGVTALSATAFPAYSADLGVLTDLDVCSAAGVSGLTLSSSDNCLSISGGVNFEAKMGNWTADGYKFPFKGTAFIARWPGMPAVYPDVIYKAGESDVETRLDAWLKFVATSPSDFGPAKATIKLLRDGQLEGQDMAIEEAWVSIGDTTKLMAGRKASIFSYDDDTALAGGPGFMGTFYSHLTAPPPVPGADGPPDSGAGRFAASKVNLGGHVIQIQSDLGNGLSVSAGLEGLDTDLNAVGVLAYKSETLSTHVSAASDIATGDWVAHMGASVRLAPVAFTAGYATDSTGYKNAVASAEAFIDMFRIAVTGEYVYFDDNAEFGGIGASATAMVSPGFAVTLAGRYFDSVKTDERALHVEAFLDAPLTETLGITAGIGAIDSSFDNALPVNPAPAAPPTPDHYGKLGQIQYAKAGLNWRPNMDTMGSVLGTVTTQGAYQLVFKGSKSFR